jgi:hypothetical protein
LIRMGVKLQQLNGYGEGGCGRATRGLPSGAIRYRLADVLKAANGLQPGSASR